jgi:BON domain
MITSVISSAARLALAPARLAGRMGGSLLQELRGNGAPDARPAPSSARAKPAGRTRSKAQPKRSAARTRAKAQPKRPAAGTRAQARPKRAPRRKPLDDATIARKVESTIFRGIDVDKGKVDVNVAERVVWLRGEVQTPDLINELEDRARRVAEVRRVENLLHLPETPAPGRTETTALQPETRGSAAPSEHRAVMPRDTSGETAGSAYGPGTRPVEAGSKGQEPAPAGSAGAAADSASGGPEDDQSAGKSISDVASLDTRPDGHEPGGKESSDGGEPHSDPAGDEPARQEGPGMARRDMDPG